MVESRRPSKQLTFLSPVFVSFATPQFSHFFHVHCKTRKTSAQQQQAQVEESEGTGGRRAGFERRNSERKKRRLKEKGKLNSLHSLKSFTLLSLLFLVLFPFSSVFLLFHARTRKRESESLSSSLSHAAKKEALSKKAEGKTLFFLLLSALAFFLFRFSFTFSKKSTLFPQNSKNERPCSFHAVSWRLLDVSCE